MMVVVGAVVVVVFQLVVVVVLVDDRRHPIDDMEDQWHSAPSVLIIIHLGSSLNVDPPLAVDHSVHKASSKASQPAFYLRKKAKGKKFKISTAIIPID